MPVNPWVMSRQRRERDYRRRIAAAEESARFNGRVLLLLAVALGIGLAWFFLS